MQNTISRQAICNCVTQSNFIYLQILLKTATQFLPVLINRKRHFMRGQFLIPARIIVILISQIVLIVLHQWGKSIGGKI